MKFVKLSQEDIENISHFYQNMIGDAREILLYIWGKAGGDKMSELIEEGEEDSLKRAKNLMEGRGWGEEIELEEDLVTAKGSIEVDKTLEMPSCNLLRGMICGLYEGVRGGLIEVKEVKCQSLDHEHCEFEIKEKKFE